MENNCFDRPPKIFVTCAKCGRPSVLVRKDGRIAKHKSYRMWGTRGKAYPCPAGDTFMDDWSFPARAWSI